MKITEADVLTSHCPSCCISLNTAKEGKTVIKKKGSLTEFISYRYRLTAYFGYLFIAEKQRFFNLWIFNLDFLITFYNWNFKQLG